jgi:hypothetical protein
LCDEFGVDGELEVVPPAFQVVAAVCVRVVAEVSEVFVGGVSVASGGRRFQDVVVVGSAPQLAPVASFLLAVPCRPARLAALQGV